MHRHHLRLTALCAALALAGAAAAQGLPPRPPPGARGPAVPPPPRFDCSRAIDPAKCEARRESFRAQLLYAQNVCESMHGEAHHSCIVRTMCAQARNPERCAEIAQRRVERRREIWEACAGRVGEELRRCVRSRGYEAAPPGEAGED